MTPTEQNTQVFNETDNYVGDDSRPRPLMFIVSLPIRLDYFSFLSELADTNNFMVSVKNGFLIIEQVKS